MEDVWFRIKSTHDGELDDKVANDWLRPLYDSFAKLLVKEEVLHADETHYQVLNRTDGREATSQARIWLFQTVKGMRNTHRLLSCRFNSCKSRR